MKHLLNKTGVSLFASARKEDIDLYSTEKLKLFKAILNRLDDNQNYSIMPKGSKKTATRCDKHDFLLRPIVENVSHPQYLTLSFCMCQEERKSRTVQNSSACLQAPTFNNDRSFASQAFILPCDKDYYKLRRNQMLEEHQLKFSFFTDEKSELNVAKPRSKNNFCNVCKQHYEDYLDVCHFSMQHINSPLHKRRLSCSPFEKDIHDLSYHFAPERLRKPSGFISKQLPVETIEQSDQVEIISNPMKRIKTNQTLEPIDLPQPSLIQRPSFASQNSLPQQMSSFHRVRENIPQNPFSVSYFNMNFFMGPFGMAPQMQFSPFPYSMNPMGGTMIPYNFAYVGPIDGGNFFQREPALGLPLDR